MYVPHAFAADGAEALAACVATRPAELVTATAEGLIATTLPLVYAPRDGELGTLRGHLARANPQWRRPAIGEALVIAQGPDAYVSPSWYPSKAEHGRVVPTWDYERVQALGRLVVHDDPAWTGEVVRALTARQELGQELPWAVDDAPGEYVAAKLRAIVGVEVVITRIDASAKWSQSRERREVEGVLAGLEAAGRVEAAAALKKANGMPLGE